MGKKVSEGVKAAEAASLRSLLDAAKVTNFARFAEEHSIPGGKSMISQHLNCGRPISLEAAVAYAIAFRCPISQISTRLADVIAQIPQPTPGKVLGAREPNHAYAVSPQRPLEQELLAIVSKLSDRGLILLIDQAEQIARRHQKSTANTAA